MPIFWSPRAKSDFLNVLEYLDNSWGKQVVIQYIQRINAVLLIIAQTPTLYPLASPSKPVRRCVVTKHTTLYYRLNAEANVEILTLFVTRRDPQKRRL